MFPVFVAIFIFLPLAELYLLIQVGSAWGAGNTVLLIILTGILGAMLARSQGLQVFLQIQQDMAKGIMPTHKLIDGLIIFAAGVVLLTPGFITDAIGFFLLWPQGRNWIKHQATRFFKQRTVDIHTIDYTVEDD